MKPRSDTTPTKCGSAPAPFSVQIALSPSVRQASRTLEFSIRPVRAKSGSEMKRKCDSFSRPLSLPECDFALFDHSRITFPLGQTSSTYFQGLGSSPKPVKLLKVLDMGELARSHSTTELLPLGSIDYKQAITSQQRRARSGAASLKFGSERRRRKKTENPQSRGRRSICGPAHPAREKL